MHYIHHQKKKLNKIIIQEINHLQYQRNNQPLSNYEKKTPTLNDSIDDVPSVTQTSKQVNQKHKQNDVENK